MYKIILKESVNDSFLLPEWSDLPNHDIDKERDMFPSYYPEYSSKLDVIRLLISQDANFYL